MGFIFYHPTISTLKCGCDINATHCTVDESLSSGTNLCFWGAATAVMPLPLPVTPTVKRSEEGST